MATLSEGKAQPAHDRQHRLARGIVALLPGLAAFIAVVGLRPLRPSNIRWIEMEDPLQSYLGWAFFRHTPWTFPLGANPRFGLEKLGGSIFYSDSIPLLAFLFKPIGAFLPEPFQYVGLWLLVCFLLQSYFAWRLLGTVTSNTTARIACVVLLVFAPPMLMRVPIHHSLAGQWIVLAGLSYNLAPPRWRITAWSILAGISALVHPYLLVMTLALWSASWIAAWLTHPTARTLLIELAVVLGGALLALWQAGALVMMRGFSLEFGVYRMNLNALFNPSVNATSVWSYVLPALGGVSPGEYEGFNFLGLGLALAACVALILIARTPRTALSLTRKWWPLGAVCLALTLLAVSNEVSFGSRLIFRYPLSEPILALVGVVHGSGRLFWPVFYTLAFVSLATILTKMRPGLSVPLLSILALLQVVDTSAGWRQTHEALNRESGRTIASPLHDPFWTEAGRVYHAVRLVRWRWLRMDWAVFATYAARAQIGTEAAYLVRVDNVRLDAVESRQLEELDRGEFDPDSLYILDDNLANTLSPRLNRQFDRLDQIDGFWVLAPGWNARRTPSTSGR